MKSSMLEGWKHIGKLSTCHGIVDFHHAQQGKQISHQLLWGLSLLCAFGAIIYYFVVITNTYIDQPTATKISEITVDFLEFPNVTICTMNKFSSKNLLSNWANLAPFFQTEIGNTSDPHSFGGWVLGVTGLTNIELDVSPAYVKLLETQYQLAFKKSIPEGLKWDVQDFLRSTATQCSDLFSSCKFAVKSFNCCANSYQVLSGYGVCYHLKPKPRGDTETAQLSVPGSMAGLHLELLHNSSDIPVFPNAKSTERGFYMSIGSYFSVFDTDTVSVAPGLYAYVSLSPIVRVLSTSSSCTRYPQRIGTFNHTGIYTRRMCQAQCYFNATKQFVGCYMVGPYLVIPSTDICSPLVAQQAVKYIVTAGDAAVDAKMRHCFMYNCSQLCETWSYPPSVTYNNVLPTTNYLSSAGPSQDVQITVADIYFQQIAYTKMEEQLLMDFSSYISSVGGALGLFAGMSILTFVQCCAAFVCMPISNLKRKQQVEERREISQQTSTVPSQVEIWRPKHAPLVMEQITGTDRRLVKAISNINFRRLSRKTSRLNETPDRLPLRHQF